MHLSTILTAAGLVRLGMAGYTLEDDYSPANFFSMFNFITGPDSSTQGYANYLSQSDAQADGLINTNNNAVHMGVDSTNVASSPGRNTIRIESKKQYNHGLVILDLGHMPGGVCGTWPAFWMYGPNWPNSGEIDILEGVNDNAVNAMTLHTSSGCTVNNQTLSGSHATSLDCWVDSASQPANEGCSFVANSPATYGSQFNANNGGTYATEWTSTAINIWFWPRGSAPSDATGSTPNPSGWGSPTAVFEGGCDIDAHFQNQNIVFDTTFCGAWAGAAWGSSGCASKASSCQAFVQNNPSAFAEAYWTVNSLQVFQNNGQQSAESVSDSGSSSAAISVSAPASVIASDSASSSPAASSLAASVTVTVTSYSTLSAVPTPASSSQVTVTVTSYSTLSAAPSQSAAPVVDAASPLQAGDFGTGSEGIPEESEGHQKRGHHHHQHVARHLRSTRRRR